MSYILRRNWRRKPPTFMRVDRSHPLAKDIRFFIDCRASVAFDLVTMQSLTMAGPIEAAVDSKQAIGSAFDGTDKFALADHVSLDMRGSVTLIWRGRFTDHAAVRQMVGKEESGVGFTYSMVTGSAGSVVTWWRYNAAVQLSKFDGSITIPTGQDLTISISQANNIETTPIGFVDRQEESFTNSSVATGAAATTTVPVQVGRAGDDGAQLLGNTNYAIGIARALTAGEILELYENPWQILEAPMRRVYVLPAAAEPPWPFLQPGLRQATPQFRIH